MKVAAIGDNCIDVYERIKKKYPTGNVVDTGVNIQKLGIPVSIISTTGSDENGKWMVETLAREGLDLSHFKVGDRLDHELVEKTLPYVDYGFYSYHKVRDAFIESYLKDKVNRGMKVAVATFGDKGSLAYDGNQFYEGGIYPAQVVNTVGAGDSFIAGFLYAVLNGADIETCLDTGAKIAAKVVSTFNPWESNYSDH